MNGMGMGEDDSSMKMMEGVMKASAVTQIVRQLPEMFAMSSPQLGMALVSLVGFVGRC